ncbi:MAG: Gfo/Idh/MocA family protein [Patescibacteria group bacterium]
MTTQVNWGILGYARIAREHVMPAIQRASNAKLHAVASRRPEGLAACRADFGPVKLYDDYDALLADPEVRAVYIPLPNSLHAEWTIRAARAGKHVLCEKPLALDAAGCRAMIEACAAHHVLLMEAFMYRYTDGTRRVLEILQCGALGEIRHVHASFHFLLARDRDVRLQPELGGGSLYDVGCYPVNFIGLVTGRAPVAVQAEAVRREGVDLRFTAVLRYEGGITASLSCGFDSHLRSRAEIIGSKGVLSIPEPFFGEAGALALESGGSRQEIPVAASDRYRLEIEDFSQAILEGRRPMLDLAETLRNMEVIERLLAAAKKA